jgi:TPR repeat protein
MAFEFGDTASGHAIGEMYRDGTGTDKDASKALEWFRSASDQGNVNSVLAIIRMKDAGTADDKCFVYAMKRLEQLAGGGNVVAMRSLGNLYFDGKSVQKDLEKAKGWFKKSAMLGDVLSINRLKSLE